MLLLKANHLKVSYGDREILSVESLSIYDQDRIGLVGKNGEGKTTLLSILADTKVPDSGDIKRYGNVAYIPQLSETSQSLHPAMASMWRLPADSHEGMSGGEQTRRKIAAALSSEANLLLADEPTSHLDISGIEQLEKELQSFSGAILLTSHDTAFLNTICTMIWEIEQGKVTVYEGNYDAYKEQKEIEIQRSHKDYEEYIREKNRLQQAAVDLQAKSHSLKKAPSRMGNSEARLHKRSVGKKKAKLNSSVEAMKTRIDKLDKKEKPREEAAISFDILEFPALHSKRVIQFNKCSLEAGSHVLKECIDGDVLNTCRLAITGANGSGKSTLLNKIATIHPDLLIAKPAKIGFFTQNQENLIETKTILDNILIDSPYNQGFIRTVLSRLAFKGDDVYKRVCDLSGGERVRVSLAKVFLGNYNVLLLDEPTNYLDIDTKEALVEVLKAYPGTIIFVTHDRAFIDSLATHVLSFEEEQPKVESRSEKEKTVGTQDNEEELLVIEMQIVAVLSRLSAVIREDEKHVLDDKFQQLLIKKKKLLGK